MAEFEHTNEHLFLPAKVLRDLEIHGDMTISDTQPRSTAAGRQLSPEEVFWNRKLDEAYDSGIMKSIERRGIVNPVQLKMGGRREPYIVNGFHRVAAAHHIDPLMFVPITYKDTPEHDEDLPIHFNREDEVHLYPNSSSRK